MIGIQTTCLLGLDAIKQLINTPQTSNTSNNIARLIFSPRHDNSDLSSKSKNDTPIGPIDPKNGKGDIKAGRDLNGISGDVPENTSGIYAFKINHPEQLLPKIYIGKTSSLRSRLSDYAEMTRRLIALKDGYRVWADKNGFRYIHYEIANALLAGANITFEYYYVPKEMSRDLTRLEQLEIAHAVVRYSQHNHYELVLNEMAGLRKQIPAAIEGTAWEPVLRFLSNDGKQS